MPQPRKTILLAVRREKGYTSKNELGVMLWEMEVRVHAPQWLRATYPSKLEQEPAYDSRKALGLYKVNIGPPGHRPPRSNWTEPSHG